MRCRRINLGIGYGAIPDGVQAWPSKAAVLCLSQSLDSNFQRNASPVKARGNNFPTV